MNSGKSKTSDPHKSLLNFSDEINWKRSDVALSNLIIYFTWKHINKSFKHNKSKISASKWNEKY